MYPYTPGRRWRPDLNYRDTEAIASRLTELIDAYRYLIDDHRRNVDDVVIHDPVDDDPTEDFPRADGLDRNHWRYGIEAIVQSPPSYEATVEPPPPDVQSASAPTTPAPDSADGNPEEPVTTLGEWRLYRRLVDDARDVEEPTDPAARMLGPDLHGLRDIPEPPPWFPQQPVPANKIASKLRKMSLTRPAPTAEEMMPDRLDEAPPERMTTVQPSGRTAAEKRWRAAGLADLPEVFVVPHIVSSIWFGGFLSGDGAMAEFRENVGSVAKRYGDTFDVIVWTDMPRSEFDGSGPEAREMRDWAEEHGVTLINVFEYFNKANPPPQFFLAELNQPLGSGYAKASDILRWVLPGVYNDGDNRIVGDLVADVRNSLEDNAGWAWFSRRDSASGAYGIGNAFLAIAQDHPLRAMALEVIGDNYTFTQRDLLTKSRATEREPQLAWRNSVMSRTGPGVLVQLYARIGGRADQAEPFGSSSSIQSGSAATWLPGHPDPDHVPLPNQAAARAERGVEELVHFTKQILAMLIRGLYNREGDLEFTAVDSAMRGMVPERRDAVLTAAVRFIAERPELARLVRTATLFSDLPHSEQHVTLPDDVENMLVLYPSQPHWRAVQRSIPAGFRERLPRADVLARVRRRLQEHHDAPAARHALRPTPRPGEGASSFDPKVIAEVALGEQLSRELVWGISRSIDRPELIEFVLGPARTFDAEPPDVARVAHWDELAARVTARGRQFVEGGADEGGEGAGRSADPDLMARAMRVLESNVFGQLPTVTSPEDAARRRALESQVADQLHRHRDEPGRAGAAARMVAALMMPLLPKGKVRVRGGAKLTKEDRTNILRLAETEGWGGRRIKPQSVDEVGCSVMSAAW
jgi:hypothetical protein